MGSRSKNWCFTIQIDAKEAKIDWKEGINHLVYCIYQIEQAPTTGQLHMQGYIHLDQIEALTYMKRHYDDGAHWEICKGSPKQNIAYCTKSESRINGPFIIGDEKNIISQGQRNDLKEMVEAKVNGAGWTEMVNQYGDQYIKMFKGINTISDMINAEKANISDKKDMTVIYLWGPPRTGKSTMARNLDNKAYIKNPDNLWWDLYTNNNTVIFEDCGEVKQEMKKTWLRWLDVYNLTEQIKGGHVVLKYTTAIITSNIPPMKMNNDLAFIARITHCYRFKEDYTCEEWNKLKTQTTALRAGEQQIAAILHNT